MELKGKRAVVCGSTQGIGWACAQKLAAMGASITLVARNAETLGKRVEELKKAHPADHQFICVDFSDYKKVKLAIVDWTVKGNQADILVNNTGGPQGGPIIDASIEQFLMAFQQHLICNHTMVQALAPGMKSKGEGRIINVISTSVKQPLPNLGVSNTIRGAVANWSKSLANELGQFNITVNNVLPGATKTARLESIAQIKADGSGESLDSVLADFGKESPMKRIALPEEVASAVAFLASPEASYINGINIPVDGGRTKSL